MTWNNPLTLCYRQNQITTFHLMNTDNPKSFQLQKPRGHAVQFIILEATSKTQNQQSITANSNNFLVISIL